MVITWLSFQPKGYTFVLKNRNLNPNLIQRNMRLIMMSNLVKKVVIVLFYPMTPRPFNFTQCTYINMTWHGCGHGIPVGHFYFTLHVTNLFIDILLSFQLRNNYIREKKKQLAKKRIFVRTFRDKRKKIKRKRWELLKKISLILIYF